VEGDGNLAAGGKEEMEENRKDKQKRNTALTQ
jgi:hypothetical protein